jgi:putative YhdH/YhfP family quinone oxidoreductase
VPTFRAWWVEEQADGTFTRRIAERDVAELPPGEVLIRVQWSSLNYKDALSATGHKGVTRVYPHTPGIDAAGIVVESTAAEFHAGDPVVVTGHDLGMNTAGGFSERVRVPADWVVPLPPGLSLRESMQLGTAGFTAGAAMERISARGVRPGNGEVLVTGASGGVGSVAVALLARAGYAVVAATGKSDAAGFLRGLGASRVVPREEVSDATSRPLLARRWAGAIDTVGGEILAAVTRSVDYEGAVAVCGNAASHDLTLTVYPFILRGVSLLGIESANLPMSERRALWARLAGEWKLGNLDLISREVALADLEPEIEAILRGGQRGRVLVRV